MCVCMGVREKNRLETMEKWADKKPCEGEQKMRETGGREDGGEKEEYNLRILMRQGEKTRAGVQPLSAGTICLTARWQLLTMWSNHVTQQAFQETPGSSCFTRRSKPRQMKSKNTTTMER